ncbi:MAG: GLPGLI family protein [Muribaculaceae bacterium]|nr:GLPGLI family protein [Muribaculaceae bacterium]MDE6754084.1 GLPGLI family protein [Muribaculaceae bacterium]
MKRISIPAIIFISGFIFANAQEYSPLYLRALQQEEAKRKTHKPLKIEKSKYLGDADMEFLYLYVCHDPESGLTLDDEFILQTGEKVSLYSNYGRYRIDSLTLANNNSGIVDNAEFHTIYDETPVSFEYIVRNHEENDSLTVYTSTLPTDHYQYEEAAPLFDWKLSDETKMIGELNCKKATTTFRGRDWEAWYTEEIPIAEGPWKFTNLPGLIVKIMDSNGEHVFSLTKVRNTTTPIGISNSYARKTDRQSFNKLKYETAKNPPIPSLPGMKLTAVEGGDGSNGKPKEVKRFTNFIEKE